MPSTDLTLLLVALAGLLCGAALVAVVNRRRLNEALSARTRELEREREQADSEAALRESEQRYRQEELERRCESLAGEKQALHEQWRESERRRESLVEELGDRRQELAAAREKLEQLETTRRQLQERERELTEARGQVTELETRLGQERKQFEGQLEVLQEAKKQLGGEFENLANRIFESKQQQFSNSSKSLLETTLDPLKTQLTEFRRKVEDVYEKENAERNRLSGQIVELQNEARKIGQEAVGLAQALKGNTKSQGNWGEVILERLLEQSGLQKGREYDTQVRRTGADGERRAPDVIVHLPEDKDIIIDAKVSLVDYERYCNTEDADERKQYLAQHIQSLRNHIRGLSIKDYEQLEGVRALDFVFIFVPVEAAFMLALQEEPGLYNEAYNKHIILASPTTLLAILRTVENIWRYEKQNKNAERIAREAGGLHDQFVLLLESLDTLDNHIGKTREAFDTARKRLASGRGNVLRRVDKLRQLGAKTKKAIGRDRLDEADEQALLPDSERDEEKEPDEQDTDDESIRTESD